MVWTAESIPAEESAKYFFPPLPEVSNPETVKTQSIYRPIILQVEVNGQYLNQPVIVLEDNLSILYIWEADLKMWRFQAPPLSEAVVFDGQVYFPLSTISDVIPIIDKAKGTLRIQARPEAFIVTARSNRYTNLPLPTKSGLGGFVNYDLFSSSSAGLVEHAAQLEFGLFNSHGVGTSNFLASNTERNPNTVRLDTTWTIDIPQKMQTFRLGDDISVPGTWGRAVRYAGVQYGTNFSTQPGFITYPMRSTKGQAVLPSTVDVFINNSLVSRQNVPPGPFTITNLPVVSGSGEVNLVVRDLMGREQIIVESFYTSQALLTKGLDNFSYDLGLVRNNFGVDSNNYSSWIASENYRRGMSDVFTGELHTEVMSDHLTTGIGGDYLIRQIGTLSTYVAASHGKTGADYTRTQNTLINSGINDGSSIKLNTKTSTTSGDLLLLGFDRLSQPWSMAIRSQWASSGFTEVGQQTYQFSPSNLVSSNLSYMSRRYGSVNIAYVSQINRDMPSNRIVTVGWGISLGRMGSLSISGLRDLAGIDSGTTFFTMWSMPLGSSHNAGLSSQSKRGVSTGNSNDFAASVQKNIPRGEGVGYFLQTRTNGTSLGAYTQQTNYGTYTAGVADDQGQTSTSLDANGGIAILGDNYFFSRRLDQSFAVAKIPDYPDVTVLADNQPVAKTDAKGEALIPRLRAYDKNEITINPSELPLDAKILGVRVEAVPYYRSGIEVKFPIERSNGATFTIELEDGTYMPVGAEVQIDSTQSQYAVGENGKVYVANLLAITKMHSTWHDQSCEFEVKYSPSSDPLPDLGIVICRGFSTNEKNKPIFKMH